MKPFIYDKFVKIVGFEKHPVEFNGDECFFGARVGYIWFRHLPPNGNRYDRWEFTANKDKGERGSLTWDYSEIKSAIYWENVSRSQQKGPMIYLSCAHLCARLFVEENGLRSLYSVRNEKTDYPLLEFGFDIPDEGIQFRKHIYRISNTTHPLWKPRINKSA